MSETVIKPFDCGDDDLNEFLTKDSKNFLSELLAVTYLYEYGNETVSFFCVSNDKISHDEKVAHGEKVFSNSEWDKFQDDIPEGKRLRGYPAVKIGRLGVNQKYKRMGIGTDLLDRLKMSFTENNKTGCRFVTVDAYNNPDTISFYTSNGFDFLTKMDVKLKTRLMYFDLVRFAIHKNVS